GEKSAEPRATIDLRAFLDLDRNGGEEVAHQTERDWQLDRRVGGNERGVRVEEVQLLEHYIDGQDRHDRRHDAVGDDPELNVVVTEPATAAATKGRDEEDEQRHPGSRRNDPVDAEVGDCDHYQHQEPDKAGDGRELHV